MAEPAREPLTILVLSGDLEKGLAAVNLSLAALSSGRQVTLFFSFWGLNLLKRRPFRGGGSILQRTFSLLNWRGASNPPLGRFHMSGAGTAAMRILMKAKRIPDFETGIKMAHSMGARLVACSTTLEIMGLRREDLLDEVSEVAGAAAFLESASQGTCLTIS